MSGAKLGLVAPKYGDIGITACLYVDTFGRFFN